VCDHSKRGAAGAGSGGTGPGAGTQAAGTEAAASAAKRRQEMSKTNEIRARHSGKSKENRL